MIDLEATCSDTLRADPDIAARVSDRVWLTMPAEPTFPCILIRRVGGAGQIAYQGLVVTDSAEIDLHCYGGSRVEALSLAQSAVVALCGAQGLPFVVRPFSMTRIPDSTLPQDKGRDRERYIASIRAQGH